MEPAHSAVNGTLSSRAIFRNPSTIAVVRRSILA
jgi:hypothetical protein